MDEALKEYQDSLRVLAETWIEVRTEYLQSQKKLIEAGNGLAGFLEDVKEYSQNRNYVKRTDSF